jgi:hypothetical protein
MPDRSYVDGRQGPKTITKTFMKKSSIAFLFVLFSMFVQAQPTSKDFNKLHWLEGKWKRTNVNPGSSSSELWAKLSNTEWRGKGISMKGADTVFVEKLKLITKEGAIYYVADVPENKAEVLFKFTQLSEHGFVCENTKHDFPQKIAYSHDGKKLKAVISWDGKSMEFLFEKE